MKMQALVALREFPYGGKRVKIAQCFMATEKDARILIALRRAQADPAGGRTIEPDARDMPTQALVDEVMAEEYPRRRGRPRKEVAA